MLQFIYGAVALFILIISTVSDILLLKKIKTLTLLDKRQQAYISDLLNYNTKIIVLQRMFFCIALLCNEKTKDFGICKFKQNFVMKRGFKVTPQNLITEFEKILNTKEFNFIVKDGKYVIDK